MLFNPPARRIKSRHSNSPTVGTTPIYSFNTQLSSVPGNEGRISVPWQWTPFAGKLQSLVVEKLFFSFLHLFCKSQSKILCGQGSHVFVFLWHSKDPGEIPSLFAHLSTSAPKHEEQLKQQKPWSFLKAPELSLPLTEGWLSEAAESYFISRFKNKFSQNHKQTVLEREIARK